MKKKIALLLCLVLCFSFAGCSFLEELSSETTNAGFDYKTFNSIVGSPANLDRSYSE